MPHTVCAGFDKNEKSSVLAMRLMKDTDLSLKQSSYLVSVSVSACCPQYKGLTDNSVNWLNRGPRLCERKGHNADARCAAGSVGFSRYRPPVLFCGCNSAQVVGE
jgi:hypothetical protein